MPLARFSLYESGVEIYIASTADDGDALAVDARPHRPRVTGVRRRAVPLPARRLVPRRLPAADEIAGMDILGRGGSAILAPGRLVPRRPALRRGGHPLRRPRARSGSYEERQRFDPAGHYHRPDVLQLRVTSDPSWTIVSSGARTAGLKSVPIVYATGNSPAWITSS